MIHLKKISLEGFLAIPDRPQGIVLFVHGSGSSRFSPRNGFVAHLLQKEHFATLLIDLLSQEEDTNYENRFNINLLTERTEEVIDWFPTQTKLKNLPIGLFGASTGAASAIRASITKNSVKAIVSRGGRTDLANIFLSNVKAPTLFIVGSEDHEVLRLNQDSYKKLTCTKKIEIIPNATHLFEEPGCLEQVAEHAKLWMQQYLIE